MGEHLDRGIRLIWELLYRVSIWALYPGNQILSLHARKRFTPASVLHISYMVHVPYFIVQTLRKHGVEADYMALGTSPVWDQCDYLVTFSRWPFIRAWQEFRIFWTIMARYQIIHSHFMVTLTYGGWEWPMLKKMGRRVVIHYRGCEIRDRENINQTFPEINICQECDYEAPPCRQKKILHRRRLAEKYGDLFLVTTPDLKMFAPQAIHLPFFLPEIDIDRYRKDIGVIRNQNGLRILHATNQPGIEGTKAIQKAVENLRQKGYKIHFVFLRGVPYETVLKEMASADFSIGKMKMGYYANAQIESMFMGVPALTYVRPEFMTEELAHSGFIFTPLAKLEKTIEHYLQHPEELEKKRAIARSSILQMHDNERLVRQLELLYTRLLQSGRSGCHGNSRGL